MDCVPRPHGFRYLISWITHQQSRGRCGGRVRGPTSPRGRSPHGFVAPSGLHQAEGPTYPVTPPPRLLQLHGGQPPLAHRLGAGVPHPTVASLHQAANDTASPRCQRYPTPPARRPTGSWRVHPTPSLPTCLDPMCHHPLDTPRSFEVLEYRVPTRAYPGGSRNPWVPVID